MIAFAMYAAFSLAVAVLVIWMVARHNAKKRQSAVDTLAGPLTRERMANANYATSTGSVTPQQPQTVVYRDSGMDPLMAGAIGYMLGSSGSNHESSGAGSCAPDAFQAGGGDMGGGGASSSWDDSSSSSSDSGSSYDSGSSDSGSSSSSD